MKRNYKELIQETNGKIFKVIFTKKDNTERELIGRLGVKKFLKGGKLKHDPSQLNHIVVFDIQKMDYRTVNLNTVQYFKCGNILKKGE